jgi:predicted cation transporter
MSQTSLFTILTIILALVLFLPLSVPWIEEEIEIFLLLMGSLSVTASGLWDHHLVIEALREPLKISSAVLLFGFLFRRWRKVVGQNARRWSNTLGIKNFIFILVIGLGLISSLITAIIAALLLVEFVAALGLEKINERRIVILSCYSIGLGAALTSLGEPLSTIAVAKLSGPPHHADFFFLTRLLWPWVLSAILLLALIARQLIHQTTKTHHHLLTTADESISDVIFRTVKIYAFVAALVLLSRGFSPIVDKNLSWMSAGKLYWVNMISAILDNATLAAAEISPHMDIPTIRSLLLGLLFSGGMMIPGNIPNIICAKKLKIKSWDWARFGIPVGLVFMTIYFVALTVSA